MAPHNIQTWKDLSKKKKKKPRRDHEKEGSQLEDVYEQDQKSVDKDSKKPSTKDKKPVREPSFHAFRVRWIVGIIIFGAFISFAAGWWVFDLSRPASSGVEVVLDGPAQVAPGGEAVFTIHIENKERSHIQNAELKMHWPSGVRVVASEPAAINDTHNTWIIDTLQSGDSFDLTVTVQMFGEEGDIKNIASSFIYELTNFSSDFYVDTAHVVTISSADLGVVFDDVTEVKPLTEQEWRIVLTNFSEDKLKDKIFEITFPEGATDITTSLESELIETADGIIARMELPTLDVEEEFSIKVSTQFSPGSQGRSALVWRYGAWQDNTLSIEQEGEHVLFVIGDEIEVEIFVNDQESIESMEWGDTFALDLIARNITTADLTNLRWEVHIPTELLITNSLFTQQVVSQPEPGVLVFGPEENEVLETLAAGEEVQVKVSAQLVGQAQSVASFDIFVQLTAETSGDSSETISFSKQFEPIALGGETVWHSSAHYFDDEGVPVGTGPMQPTVGQASAYEMQWNISAISTNVDRLELRTTLPEGVLWTGQTSALVGNVTFTSSNREVLWVITNPAQTIGQGELQATWQAGVVPEVGQLGQVIPLTGAVQLTIYKGAEATTVSQSALTTELAGDLYAVTDGRVVN